MKLAITKETYQLGRKCVRMAPNRSGYFLVQNEFNHLFTLVAKSYGYEIPDGLQPEISVGICFSKYLKANFDTLDGDIISYIQEVKYGRRVHTKLYSNSLLSVFRDFFYLVWLKEKGYTYFSKVDKKALPVIKMIVNYWGDGYLQAS
ncbi:hypothetical protein J5U18_01665 [Sphingobacteriaceae bacterium WQ 2009]|uniref:BstA-like C-terminal domain-containing protein n=1 Tax=Rhinopithecimicrobium faecis TaxID=2820698 RepID=A0A8T4HBX1_9SPHI|nr:hypothetical protein [Sphingobacteriaceae bacterium WQ 2009]